MSGVGTISEAKMDASSFEWTISNFFMKADCREPCSSPSFSFSGCDWHLEMLPQYDESVAFRLEREYSDSDKTVTYILGATEVDGTVVDYMENTKTFKRNDSYGDYDVFWSIDYFQSRKSQLAPTDTLTFTLRIWSYETTYAISARKPSKFMELEALSSDFNDLFVGQKICDATLKVKDREFKVHRAVLAARSSVFSAMFENTMSEQETGVVDVSDCDPESFGEFLKYLYTGELESISGKDACHLYFTAHKYDVQHLKSFCVIHFRQNMCVDGFCDVAALAELHDDDELMSSAQTFFDGNYAEIVSTSEWERLMGRNYRLASKLLRAAFKHKI